MDLRGLESTQWRGFSDREIQHYHSNIKQEPKAKLEIKGNVLRTQHQSVATTGDRGRNGEVDSLKNDLDCGASKSQPQPLNATLDDESKEVATPPLEAPTETDLAHEPYVDTSLSSQTLACHSVDHAKHCSVWGSCLWDYVNHILLYISYVWIHVRSHDDLWCGDQLQCADHHWGGYPGPPTSTSCSFRQNTVRTFAVASQLAESAPLTTPDLGG